VLINLINSLLHEPVFHLDYSINTCCIRMLICGRTVFVDNDQPEDGTIKNSSKDALPHTIDHSNKKKLSCPNMEVMDVEIEEHNSTPTEDGIILGSSSNSEGERTNHDRKVKVLPTPFS
jgi:hypothetical protein